MIRHLYLLKRTDVIGTDELAACVVRARTANHARAFAAAAHGDESTTVWLDKNVTTCELLTNDNGDSGLVLCDFRVG